MEYPYGCINSIVLIRAILVLHGAWCMVLGVWILLCFLNDNYRILLKYEMKQEQLIRKVGDIILGINSTHPLRVGINGVDASGKTMFAKKLAEYLKGSKRQIIQASIDGYHNSKSKRYQLGRDSPEGYFRDSFNNSALISHLLAPLGPNGNLTFKTEIFDYQTDSVVFALAERADLKAVLLLDGVFLFRTELLDFFDLKIFLKVDFSISVARAQKRDGFYLGSEEEILDKYKIRYVPGQQLYLKECNPENLSDIVINNNDFNNPFIEKNRFEDFDESMAR